MSEQAHLSRLFIMAPWARANLRWVDTSLITWLCFRDSDAEIETRAGADFTWIFDVEGEEGFRRRETAVLEDLARRSQAVIATGGGAILAPANRDLMARSGVVVFLNVSVAQQLKRTGSGEGRPLLQQGDREET